MHDGTVTDGDAVADVGGDPLVGVDDGPVLDVAVVADDADVGVAAQDRREAREPTPCS